MCGIAGIAGPGDPVSAADAVRKITSALERRGPDGQGLHQWPGATFGHRRLAIIDLSPAGAQPMLSPDGRLGVSFNGCIYNFQELRAELQGAGCAFRSKCDTEVLLHGYRVWGLDGMARRLRGMFAFALWDAAQRRLFLVRDRLGVKPLIYAERDGSIAFASTVEALRRGGFGSEIDPAAVLEFLEWGYVTDDRTIYRGVRKLAAASILEWHEGKSSVRSYWQLPEPDPDSRITFDEAVEETERLVLEAVRLRLIADVPVGALLSGGIDSTLVCWATAKLNSGIQAFTVGTEGDIYDETAHAVETARILGIPHQVVTLPASQDGLLDELISAYGEPFGCSSAMGMLQVSSAVRQHATVLLTGDGGDDVFLGYPFHWNFLQAEKMARLLPSGSGALWNLVRPAFSAVPQLRRVKHFLDYSTGGLGAITRVNDGLPWYFSRQLPGERLRGQELSQRNIPLSQAAARDLFSRFIAYQQRTWFVAEFMTKVDGATMHHHLEARSPFLDHVLWEFAATLPPSLRMQGGRLKAILREIVSRRVGPETANRRKQGFVVPVENWLTGRWKAALTALADDSPLESQGWIARGRLASAVQEARTRGTASRQLWYLVVLDRWLRTHAV